VIEDDYDADFRFAGRPLSVLQSLDSGNNVILVGTFNKLLFPALRLGYVVLPPNLVDPFRELRFGADLRTTSLDQAVLCDFIVEGHLGRHMRRMSELYAVRLRALRDAGERYLKGLVEIADVQTGLFTAGFLQNGMSSHRAESSLAEEGVQTIGMHRFAAETADPKGILLGFAAFDEDEIRDGAIRMARALERKSPG